MPVTSLSSKYGIGCFSKEAYDFIDFLRSAKQTYWQILPLGITGYGDSPYQSFSAFAGNPYMIDLESLINEDVLTKEECENADMETLSGDIDYAKLYKNRYPLLRKAFERSDLKKNEEYKKFESENSYWLEDYALFMAIKDSYGGIAWTEWDNNIRFRTDNSLEEYRCKLRKDINFHKYIQYKFYMQWLALKNYANKNGIKIVGDIPIYAAMDSADAWVNGELFQFDEQKLPRAAAGCPPDGFSAEGQLWGNPLYDWEYHKKTGYDWWKKRLSQCFLLYDAVRIDHFRGFDEYYSIPYGDKNAVNGRWEKGPGYEFFENVKEVIGGKEIIAEDLGYVTDSVRELVYKTGFAGMKVLEFAFDSRDSGAKNDYLPHNYPENCAVYTGTHDNAAINDWFGSITDAERRTAREYLCDYSTPDENLNISFISLIMRSNARICIIPIQDYMGLGSEARINIPSTLGGNWKWRLKEGELTDDLCRMIKGITQRYGRSNTMP